MTAEAALLTRTWRVGSYTCTLTAQRPRPGAMVASSIEWAPEQPRHLTEAELLEYLNGRNKALAEVGAALGVTAMVIDL